LVKEELVTEAVVRGQLQNINIAASGKRAGKKEKLLAALVVMLSRAFTFSAPHLKALTSAATNSVSKASNEKEIREGVPFARHLGDPSVFKVRSAFMWICLRMSPVSLSRTVVVAAEPRVPAFCVWFHIVSASRFRESY
jgi:hypothetical protein